MAVGTAIGSVLGGIGGAAIGVPAGAQIGAGIGGAIGGGIEELSKGKVVQPPLEDPRMAGLIADIRRRRMRFERQGIPALTRPLQESLQVGLRNALRFGESGAALGLAGRLQRQTGQAMLEAGLAGQQAAAQLGAQELALEENRAQRRLELQLLQRQQRLAQRAQTVKGVTSNLLAGVAMGGLGGAGGIPQSDSQRSQVMGGLGGIDFQSILSASLGGGAAAPATAAGGIGGTPQSFSVNR